MFKKKFFFIVFEGTEGTGKSYQINKLFSNLKKNNIQSIKTREPGGTKTAENIRKLIFGKKSNKLDSLTDYYLMLAARNEHVKKLLIPAKKNKRIVISDRFVDSTYAYQVIGNKINSRINKINQEYILDDLKPNLVIILKANFNIISKRLRQRKSMNKFDFLKKSFYTKVQNAFIQIAKKNSKNYLIFNSSKNNKDLEKEILKKVLFLINK